MSIQGYASQYAQAWGISTHNIIKAGIPALAAGFLAYKGLEHYTPKPILPALSSPRHHRSPEDAATIKHYREAGDRRTKAIRAVPVTCGLITLGCAVKRWPLKPLSVFQMNSMGVSAVAIFAIPKYIPSPPSKFKLAVEVLLFGSFCIPVFGCGASALGRLGGLISNCAQRVFNR